MTEEEFKNLNIGDTLLYVNNDGWAPKGTYFKIASKNTNKIGLIPDVSDPKALSPYFKDIDKLGYPVGHGYIKIQFEFVPRITMPAHRLEMIDD